MRYHLFWALCGYTSDLEIIVPFDSEFPIRTHGGDVHPKGMNQTSCR
jgi:hypothetical protein